MGGVTAREKFRLAIAEHGVVVHATELAALIGVTRQRVCQIAETEGVRLQRPLSETAKKQAEVEERKRTRPAKRIRDFWSRTDRSGECWEWTGATYPNGYGACNLFGLGYAHRVAYYLTYGPIPKDGPGRLGYCVMHTCDNRPCCNPAHLRLGTQADNVADRDAKGRAAWQKDPDGWQRAATERARTRWERKRKTA